MIILLFFFVENNTCVDTKELEYFMSKVVMDSDFALRTLQNETVSTKWDFSGAFSFVVTVVSTIGKYYRHVRVTACVPNGKVL